MTTRTVLLGNTAPIQTIRETVDLDDLEDGEGLDDRRLRVIDDEDPYSAADFEADAQDALASNDDEQVKVLAFNPDRPRIGVMRVTRPVEGNSITVVRVPGDTGLGEALSAVVRVYEQDCSDDLPEWVESDDAVLREAVRDHYDRQGHECRVGRPSGWEIDPSNDHPPVSPDEPFDPDAPLPIGGGALGTSFTPDCFSEEFRAAWREHELRTNAGGDFQARVMGDTASNATASYASATWIALSTNATAPALGDTALTGELTASGLGRAQAVYAHTNGTTTYTLTKTFTSADPTPRTIEKVGVLNASVTGTLVFETAVPSPPVLASGDSLTVTETVTM